MVPINREELTRFRQHAADAKWLMLNYDKYRGQYGGKYVAVHKGKIVGHNRDLLKLKAKIGQINVFIQYVYKEKPELIL
jgi:hypothetical protein